LGEKELLDGKKLNELIEKGRAAKDEHIKKRWVCPIGQLRDSSLKGGLRRV